MFKCSKEERVNPSTRKEEMEIIKLNIDIFRELNREEKPGK